MKYSGYSISVVDFLKEKGMIIDGCSEFIIKGEFGTVSLNDLLKEYVKISLKEKMIVNGINQKDTIKGEIKITPE